MPSRPRFQPARFPPRLKFTTPKKLKNRRPACGRRCRGRGLFNGDRAVKRLTGILHRALDRLTGGSRCVPGSGRRVASSSRGIAGHVGGGIGRVLSRSPHSRASGLGGVAGSGCSRARSLTGSFGGGLGSRHSLTGSAFGGGGSLGRGALDGGCGTCGGTFDRSRGLGCSAFDGSGRGFSRGSGRGGGGRRSFSRGGGGHGRRFAGRGRSLIAAHEILQDEIGNRQRQQDPDDQRQGRGATLDRLDTPFRRRGTMRIGGIGAAGIVRVVIGHDGSFVYEFHSSIGTTGALPPACDPAILRLTLGYRTSSACCHIFHPASDIR